jgi:hypothetical protein
MIALPLRHLHGDKQSGAHVIFSPMLAKTAENPK